jgi:hypothetical protein
VIIEKPISTPLLQRLLEMDAHSPIPQPTHLTRNRAAVKQLKRHAFSDVGIAGEADHHAGARQIDQGHEMIFAAKGQRGSLAARFGPNLRPLVEHSFDGTRYHVAMKLEPR